MRGKEEITAEKYQKYLDMDYPTFREEVHMHGVWAEGPYDYSYCVSEDHDCPGARLDYINYLVNEKGFAL